MAVNITDADNYIGLNVIQAEDWQDSDSAKKQRLLNVAERELSSLYEDYFIPDNAVYEYAAVLSVAFSDTLKNRQNGIASFSIAGMSFTFKEGKDSLTSLVPTQSKRLISKDLNNDHLPELSTSKIRWTVL